VILALTGAVLVVNTRMGEQQRPAQVTRLTRADAIGVVSRGS
jgi:hypothetical protein